MTGQTVSPADGRKSAEEERATPPHVNRRIMTLSCLLVFMAQMATTIYLPSLPVVAHDFGMSRGYAALTVSAFVIGAAAPVVLWGVAADRYGRRGPLLTSLALFVLTSALVPLLRFPEGLLVLRALQGIGAGGSAIIARILVRDRWSGDELARRLSVLSIAFITAMGGGQFLGGLIGRYSHWETGFVVLAAVGTVAAALTFTVPFASSRAERRPSEVLRICLAIGRQPGFLLPALAGGAGFATIVMLQEVSPFVFQQHFGLAPEQYGSLGLLLGAAYFAGALTVNRLVAKVGSGRLMTAGSIVMTAAQPGDDGAVVRAGSARWRRSGGFRRAVLRDHVRAVRAVPQQYGHRRQRPAHARRLRRFPVRLPPAVDGGSGRRRRRTAAHRPRLGHGRRRTGGAAAWLMTRFAASSAPHRREVTRRSPRPPRTGCDGGARARTGAA
ncbi:hypothetical protein GCM10020000_03600 [Streptomyces olivoverticillatus]